MADLGKLPERMRRRIRVEPDGCWSWVGVLDRDGYGRITEGNRPALAHRVIYMRLVGPIEAGLTIDHLCRKRACVNPEHLEPVPQGLNTIRGNTLQGRNARKVACHRGHPFDEVNTYIRNDRGHRECRACAAARAARYQAQRELERS